MEFVRTIIRNTRLIGTPPVAILLDSVRENRVKSMAGAGSNTGRRRVARHERDVTAICNLVAHSAISRRHVIDSGATVDQEKSTRTTTNSPDVVVVARRRDTADLRTRRDATRRDASALPFIGPTSSLYLSLRPRKSPRLSAAAAAAAAATAFAQLRSWDASEPHVDRTAAIFAAAPCRSLLRQLT